MIKEDARDRVWYVVFCSPNTDSWILNRLKYAHVYAMRKSPGGKYWTVINPTTCVIDAETIPVEICPSPMDFSDKALVMIRCDVRADAAKPFRLRIGVFSCVSVIMGLLGMRKAFVYTPKQLFNQLQVTYGH